MIRINKKKIKSYSAKIYWEGKQLGMLKNVWLEKLLDGIVNIPNELQRDEAMIFWNCVREGNKVEATKKEIALYFDKGNFNTEPDIVITENLELCSLLENFVQFCKTQKAIHS